MRNDLSKHSREAEVLAAALLKLAFPDFPCEGQGDRVVRTVSFGGSTWACRLLRPQPNTPRGFFMNLRRRGRWASIQGRAEHAAGGGFRVSLTSYERDRTWPVPYL